MKGAIILAVALWTISIPVRAVVTDTDCPKGDECTVSHSSCDTTSHKCKCDNGYKVNADACDKVFNSSCTDNATCAGLTNSICTGGKCTCATGYRQKNDICEQTVSGTTCATKGTECDSIDHSSCGTGSKCKCDDGYAENVDQCTQVYDTTCTGTGSCSGLTNSKCAGGKCTCATGYGQKNNICVQTVTATACTAKGTQCDSIAHSSCDTTELKCKCDDGYTENVDQCKQGSGAESAKAMIWMVFGPMLVFLVQRVM